MYVRFAPASYGSNVPFKLIETGSLTYGTEGLIVMFKLNSVYIATSFD